MPLVPYTSTSTVTVPAVAISAIGPASYSTIMLSLGTDLYFKVEDIYLYSTVNAQLLQPFQYEKYNVDGNISQTPLTPTVDPYQRQNSLVYSPDFLAILDGRSQFNVTLLPLSDLTLLFYGEEIYLADQCIVDNFDNIIKAEGGALAEFFFGTQTSFQ